MAILDAVALWSDGQRQRGNPALTAHQNEELALVKATQSLRSPDLSPVTLAQNAGISVRTLHRLFMASGTTFRAWLRDCRLERCWMELTHPGTRKTAVAAVAVLELTPSPGKFVRTVVRKDIPSEQAVSPAE